MKSFTRLNPITDEPASSAKAMTVAQAIAIADEAAAAFPVWAALGPNTRRAALLKVADSMIVRTEDFVSAMVSETGATRGWAAFNVNLAVSMVREAAALTTQISSMPASRASSAMIWRTGLVRPSRSTRGSIAFWTVSEAGYCRAPRPAAVMTALVICTAVGPS